MATVCGVFRIVKDLELKVVGDNKKVLNLRLADNRDKDSPQFFNGRAWAGKAETICAHFKKGNKINISASRLRQRYYKDKDGNQKEEVWFDIHDFEFVDKKDDGDVGF